MIEQYVKQVKLLVNVLPYIAKENCFALKGGTAINLFIRDLPRLEYLLKKTIQLKQQALSDFECEVFN